MTVKELIDYLFMVNDNCEVKMIQCPKDSLLDGVSIAEVFEVKAICGTERKPELVLIPND